MLRDARSRSQRSVSELLGIVYRAIAKHLAQQAGFSAKRARTGAATLIQRSRDRNVARA
jgi:hypothetical protein